MPNTSLRLRFWLILLGSVLSIAGAFFVVFGGRLVMLQGSAYYLVAGLALVVSGWLLMRRRSAGAVLYGWLFAMTVAWAWHEAGWQFWPLLARLQFFAFVMILVAITFPALRRDEGRTPWRKASHTSALLLALASAAGIWGMFEVHPLVAPAATTAITAASSDQPGNWEHYGNTPGASRFVALSQLTPANVSHLQVAWTFHTGDTPISHSGNGAEDQQTPLQIGDTLYLCTPHNNVIALDAATGQQRWQTRLDAHQDKWMRCRGLAYFDASRAIVQPSSPGASTVPAGRIEAGAQCQQRILLNTIEDQLVALDAHTGAFCPGFGVQGRVDLKAGIGQGAESGDYSLTSAPTLAGTTVVVGGRVADNVSNDMPGGVLRGFDVMTGALRWAFDAGKTGEPPYSRSTPNAWAPMSYDPTSNTLFIPLGSAALDFVGTTHNPIDRQYGASMLALDAGSGQEKWHFQTVHDDLWDFDVPMQPSLIDFALPGGQRTPALVFGTKAGQLFVLDRSTGTPLTAVTEQAVNPGAIPGETYSATQPISTGMPQIGTATLTEADMWGTTPFDQLLCRVQFKALRYDGLFTPPGLEPTLNLPGSLGGMNWGGLSLDPLRHYLFVNDMRVGLEMQLGETDHPHAHNDIAATSDSRPRKPQPMQGTPYAIKVKQRFVSPLGIPCQKPPFGTLTAINLDTRQIAWQMPVGTVQDTGPLGIKMHLPIPIGMPTLGGTLATQGGLLFIAATQDYYLRAYDSATGEERWKGRLPVGSQGTPISYRAGGKQYVLISAGGARNSKDRGDYVIAYALPE
jgi:quinate dehydrogenase (quinone)